MRSLAVLTLAASFVAGSVAAQSPEWRTVDPENLLVIETTRGRVLVEMVPEAAPQHVERVRILARQGFYDGAPFHRVMPGFMAQTGDPTGTGQGGSELPDLQAEFTFRRGDSPAYIEVTGSDSSFSRPAGIQLGMFGGLPVQTQPDGQMFATRDGRVDAQAWFCRGVIGSARTADNVNSANSQFYIMTAPNMNLNGQYTVWGRVIGPMDAIDQLRTGALGSGAVPVAERDSMTRVRIAADMPENERPGARVLDVRSARFAEIVEAQRAGRGSQFSICDVMPPAEIQG